MVSHGVPREELQALGLSSQELRSLSFAALLRSLPEEKAVQLQFWNSVPGVWTMAAGLPPCQWHAPWRR